MNELEKSFENFKKRLANNGDLPREVLPPSQELLDYIAKVNKDPNVTLTDEQIIASIKQKLDKKAIGRVFNLTESQRSIMNALWLYFKGKQPLDPKKGVIIYGTHGCGKTQILKSYATTHFGSYNPNNNEKPCIVTSAIEMVEYFNTDGNFRRFYENNIYIDDLGSEQRAAYMSKSDDPILSKYFELFYLNCSYKLYITTNFTKQELKDKYGDRVFSRLHEICNFIELNDLDFRMK